MNKLELLKKLDFGERVAEDDTNLVNYFVETNIWRQLEQDKVDVIYGAKGSGKSALYKYLLTKKDSLLTSNKLLISAENIKGVPVFKQVLSNNNLNEDDFKQLWFLYILTLLGSRLNDLDKKTSESKAFIKKLEDEKLLCSGPLKNLLNNVRTYIQKHFLNPESVEHSVSFDESGTPTFSRKISFTEPSPELKSLGCISAYDLLEMANDALESLSLDSWITFDRLDVAFDDNTDLEAIALRSLFKVYNDIKSASHIKLKIFIRDDIWKRITEDGIREGSHITKQTTIRWNEQDFLFLLVSRIVDNESLCSYFDINKNDILRDKEKQNSLFYNIFPEQVKSGNNPKTFKWMLSRVEDGLGISAPRELIHLLNESKEQQIQLLETGTKEDSYDGLISRAALIQALREVSKVRLEQTIYQEYPDLKHYIELLEEEKTEQDIKSLSKIFNENINNTKIISNKLVSIGFFKEKEKNNLYWVPFLYRDALNMSQGKKRK